MILITGVTGQLGTAFRKRLGDGAHYLARTDLDLSDVSSIRPTLEGLRPAVVINCAAYTAVDAAEADEETARLVNSTAVEELARTTARLGAKLVTFSTDFVFDGTKTGAYVEPDETNPLNAYGRTKLDGEQRALHANPDTLVIRTSWVLSGTHPNFAATMLRLMAEGPVTVIDDQHGHPTLVGDLVVAALAALDADASGILHITNAGTTSWFGLAREIAAIAGLDGELVQPVPASEYPTPAQRPANSVLESVRLDELGLDPLRDYHEPLEAAVAQLHSS